MTDDWRSQARCRGVDPDLFFPDRGDMACIAAAKAVCAGCPVRLPCLEAGLYEVYGVWGGVTARGREPLRGRTRRNPVSMYRHVTEVREPYCVDEQEAV